MKELEQTPAFIFVTEEEQDAESEEVFWLRRGESKRWSPATSGVQARAPTDPIRRHLLFSGLSCEEGDPAAKARVDKGTPQNRPLAIPKPIRTFNFSAPTTSPDKYQNGHPTGSRARCTSQNTPKDER